jgi:hypothetical protein
LNEEADEAEDEDDDEELDEDDDELPHTLLNCSLIAINSFNRFVVVFFVSAAEVACCFLAASAAAAADLAISRFSMQNAEAFLDNIISFIKADFESVLNWGRIERWDIDNG